MTTEDTEKRLALALTANQRLRAFLKLVRVFDMDGMDHVRGPYKECELCTPKTCPNCGAKKAYHYQGIWDGMMMACDQCGFGLLWND